MIVVFSLLNHHSFRVWCVPPLPWKRVGVWGSANRRDQVSHTRRMRAYHNNMYGLGRQLDDPCGICRFRTCCNYPTNIVDFKRRHIRNRSNSIFFSRSGIILNVTYGSAPIRHVFWKLISRFFFDVKPSFSGQAIRRRIRPERCFCLHSRAECIHSARSFHS